MIDLTPLLLERAKRGQQTGSSISPTLVRLIKATRTAKLYGLHLVQAGRTAAETILDGGLYHLIQQARQNLPEDSGQITPYPQGATALAATRASPLITAYRNAARAADAAGMDVSATARSFSALRLGSSPLIVLVEAWNLAQASSDAAKSRESDAYSTSRKWAASVALAFAATQTTQHIVGKERAAAWLSHQLARGNNVLYRAAGISLNALEDPEVRKLAAGRLLARSMSGFGAATAGLGAYLSYQDMGKAFARNDDDSGAAYAISTALTGVLALNASLGAIGIGSIGMLAGPLGWAVFAGSFAALLIGSALSDNKFEEWAKNGPFGANPDDRLTGAFRYWEENRQACYGELASLFCKPTLTIHAANSMDSNTDVVGRANELIVDVDAPGPPLEPEQVELHVSVALISPGPHFSEIEGEQRLLEVASVESIYAADAPPISAGHADPTGTPTSQPIAPTSGGRKILRYRFRHIDTKAIVRAKVRYSPADGILIPAIARRYDSGELVTETDNSPQIHPDKPGWVYATLES